MKFSRALQFSILWRKRPLSEATHKFLNLTGWPALKRRTAHSVCTLRSIQLTGIWQNCFHWTDWDWLGLRMVMCHASMRLRFLASYVHSVPSDQSSEIHFRWINQSFEVLLHFLLLNGLWIDSRSTSLYFARELWLLSKLELDLYFLCFESWYPTIFLRCGTIPVLDKNFWFKILPLVLSFWALNIVSWILGFFVYF